jgi:hypothetical protein
LSFVFREFLVAMGRNIGVESDGNMCGLLVLQNIQQRLSEPLKRGGVDSFRSEDWPVNQREMRAINQRHSIQQK